MNRLSDVFFRLKGAPRRVYTGLRDGLRAFRATPFKVAGRVGKNVGLTSLYLVNGAAAVHLFSDYVGNVSPMQGPSMLPTLAIDGEYVIENIIGHRLNPSNISRGDLITFRSPHYHHRIVCKRVVGLAGDIVCVDPTGLKFPSSVHVLVPKGHIWVAGDNAALSIDSRDYGPLSTALIRGKLFARVWPPRDAVIFRNPTTYIE
ncbi:peptidase S24/S26A/S26B/S26C [Pterulicium gracile]|uniref:Peptidase S24/S26A/S26B/S26C n=1 Tax=Pterulicium gracile TaxID=1884261 RepID=A0A5C3R669_9AGAR|nr:peptidase S24/S26A/S26B/S26C [Pterula gracilis]